MSYKIESGGIFPYVKMGDYELRISSNFDLEEDTEMDISIVSGKILAFSRKNIPQKELTDLIKNGDIHSQLNSSELSTIIEENKNKILHFIENHEDYMKGPDYPDYESIKD